MLDYSKFIKVCKRVNNKKRKFLVLNKAQCKHVPSSPTQALEMFMDLAATLDKYKYNPTVLVVGFAETATAIGATVASWLQCDYIHTTREDIGDDYLEFSESHSHATEQKLKRVSLDRYHRIIFVEDEVTTGATILKLIDELKKIKPTLSYTVASIINSMSEYNLEMYKRLKIEVKYLIQVDNSGFDTIADNITADGDTVDAMWDYANSISFHPLADARTGVDMEQYERDIQGMCSDVYVDKPCTILVLGTEELMYPAIRLGARLEQAGNVVKCHSTTRSPICTVSKETDPQYPLYSAHRLMSVYDSSRETFLYNMGVYDKVFIVTDALPSSIGLSQLIRTLRGIGNKDITQIILERRPQ